MRIVFIGSVTFSRRMLETVLQIPNAEVVGIATKLNSSFNADHSDLSDIAIKNKIPFRYCGNINSEENLQWIRGFYPDVIYCFGWSSLIGGELLKIPEKGVIGYHPAKLPNNRGRHPIIWALVLGLSKTGSTFFIMDEGADSGDILSQEEIEIHPSDNASSLYNLIIEKAIKQVKEFTPKLANNDYKLTKQNESQANYWRKRGPKDGEIDFRMSSEAINNLVRGLTRPYVGAHFNFNCKEYKVWETKIGPTSEANWESGKIIQVTKGNKILVKTGNGSIWLTDHELEISPTLNNYFQ